MYSNRKIFFSFNFVLLFLYKQTNFFLLFYIATTPSNQYSNQQNSTSILSPRPQAPPSNLPTDRLTSQADQLLSTSSNNNNNSNRSNSPSLNYQQQKQFKPQSPLPQQSSSHYQQHQQQQQYPLQHQTSYNNGSNYVTQSQQQNQQQQNYNYPLQQQQQLNQNSNRNSPVPQSNYYQIPPQPIPTRRGAYSEPVPREPSFSQQQSNYSTSNSTSSNSNNLQQSSNQGYYQIPSPGQSSPSMDPRNHRSSSSNGINNNGRSSTPNLDSLSLSNNTSTRSYYATPEDGPPYKLSVVHPDQKALGLLRERAMSGGVNGQGDMIAKVAWSKQVLKFIERHQVSHIRSLNANFPLAGLSFSLIRISEKADFSNSNFEILVFSRRII